MTHYKQKFHRGDLVRIAKDTDFPEDRDAIVLGSYADEYGGQDKHSRSEYDLYIKGSGEESWYSEHQLTLLAHNKMSLAKEWRKEAKAKEKAEAEKYNLDYIFSNGPKILRDVNKKGIPTALILGLLKHINITEKDLWGSHGEGMTFYLNCYSILERATKFIKKNDKEGWLKYSKDLYGKRPQDLTYEA